MQQSTLTKLALLVFGLVFVSFVVRGFGQFVVGPRRAMLVAGPLAVLAAGLLGLVVALWLLGRAGIVRIDSVEPTDRE
jgi:hypothetical protein